MTAPSSELIAAARFEALPTVNVGEVAVPLAIRTHAVERWRQRVAPDASASQAALQLQRFIAGARVRGRGPKWVKQRAAVGGARFISNPMWPHVVGLIAPSSHAHGVLSLLTVYVRRYDDANTLRLIEREHRMVIRRKTETRKGYSRRNR